MRAWPAKYETCRFRAYLSKGRKIHMANYNALFPSPDNPHLSLRPVSYTHLSPSISSPPSPTASSSREKATKTSPKSSTPTPVSYTHLLRREDWPGPSHAHFHRFPGWKYPDVDVYKRQTVSVSYADTFSFRSKVNTLKPRSAREKEKAAF